MSVQTLTDGESIAQLAASLDSAPFVGLDTEFMRERTYRPQLCLLQLATPRQISCVDPLAEVSLEPLAAVLRTSAIPKILHAARQDLEVLWPSFGPVGPVFDTQIAAGLTGLPAQIGYSDLVQRLLGVSLTKAETRTDWSRRPLSEAQLRYAADDVVHLGPLRDLLGEKLERLGRLDWLAEDQHDLANPARLFVDPEKAFERLRWSGDLDPERARLAQRLAAWRERRASDKDRPRSWILDDTGLRTLVMQAPRTAAALAALPDLAPGFVERSGAAILAEIDAAQLPERLPPLPQRSRPDPERQALVKRLSTEVQKVATELQLSPELLATRKDLEAIAEGGADSAALQGWRGTVLGARLLALRPA